MHSGQETASASPCAEVIEYKPLGFYFRRALRGNDDAPYLVSIIIALRDELRLCWDFANENAVKHTSPTGYWPSLPAGVKELRTIGLSHCCELEEIRQRIRADGLIPPRKNCMTDEPEAKGWSYS